MSWEPWPACPSDGGGGGAPAKVPALQPNLYGALAMYSMEADLATRSVLGADRSGNGFSLASVNAFAVPDLVPGKQISLNYFATTQETVAIVAPSGSRGAANYPALELTGEMSITCRAFCYMYPTSAAPAAYQYLVGNCYYGSATDQYYSIVADKDNPVTNALTYYCYRTAGGVGGVHFRSTLQINDSKWHFVTMRRAASGVVTLGVDGVYQSSGVLPFPDVTQNGSRVGVGRYGRSTNDLAVLPNQGLMGAVADLCIWPTALSDAQLTVLQNVAMGT